MIMKPIVAFYMEMLLETDRAYRRLSSGKGAVVNYKIIDNLIGITPFETSEMIDTLLEAGFLIKTEEGEENPFISTSYTISKDGEKILKELEQEITEDSIICHSKDREHLVSYFRNGLSRQTLETYTITIPAVGVLEFSLKDTFKDVDVFLKNGSELKLNIPSRGSIAYTLKDAENYYNLLRGCDEINKVLSTILKERGTI